MYSHTATCDRCGASESWEDSHERAVKIPGGYAKFRITLINSRNYDRGREFLICHRCQVEMKIAPENGAEGEVERGIEARLLDIVTELVYQTLQNERQE